MFELETTRNVEIPGFKVFKQGAEGILYTGTCFNKPTIVKERFCKTYRNPTLDTTLTKERMKAEIRALIRCKSIGIKTPTIYMVIFPQRRIYMEHFIHSVTVKQFIQESEPDQSRLSQLAHQIGKQIGIMHLNNVIHGDLTTSNMLLINKNGLDEYKNLGELELGFIDFGLAHIDSSVEDKGVDLYVLERAMGSTHSVTDAIWPSIIEGYKSGLKKGFKEVFVKYEDIKARGRKRTMVG